MDENTLKALKDLTEKLGTTAEHLWGVLIKQAPISGIIDLCVMVGWVLFTAYLFRFVKSKTTAAPETETNQYPSADWEDEGAVLAWIIVLAVAILVIAYIGDGLSMIVAALFNPEYWALKQLLN